MRGPDGIKSNEVTFYSTVNPKQMWTSNDRLTFPGVVFLSNSR